MHFRFRFGRADDGKLLASRAPSSCIRLVLFNGKSRLLTSLKFSLKFLAFHWIAKSILALVLRLFLLIARRIKTDIKSDTKGNSYFSSSHFSQSRNLAIFNRNFLSTHCTKSSSPNCDCIKSSQMSEYIFRYLDNMFWINFAVNFSRMLMSSFSKRSCLSARLW